MKNYSSRWCIISCTLRRSCIAFGLLIFLVACAEVPLTKRKSLQLLPQSQLLVLSLQQYSKVLKESKLSSDQEKVQMVKRVGKRIAMAAREFLKDSGFGWQIKDCKHQVLYF